LYKSRSKTKEEYERREDTAATLGTQELAITLSPVSRSKPDRYFKLQVLQPSVFSLDEAFRATEWTMVRRKKKVVYRRSSSWGSTAHAPGEAMKLGRGSTAHAPAEITRACARHSNHGISRMISNLGLDMANGHKFLGLESSTFFLTGHKGQGENSYCKNKIKGTRPNFFLVTRVLGL
jgi:hypothetical protein